MSAFATSGGHGDGPPADASGDGAERPAGHPAVDADGAPVFADDGTDLTVIRWMLALTPIDRLGWLQDHLHAIAGIRRDQRDP